MRPQRWQLTRLPRPWDSPGKNTGVGCHFPLQCMKVKSESEAAQSCPTLSDPMDCSPPGPSIHGIFQARVLEWGTIAFSEKHILRRSKFKGQRNRVHLLMDNQCYIVRIHGMENISMIIFGTYLLHFFFFLANCDFYFYPLL